VVAEGGHKGRPYKDALTAAATRNKRLPLDEGFNHIIIALSPLGQSLSY
jgi:hypothetical protein